MEIINNYDRTIRDSSFIRKIIQGGTYINITFNHCIISNSSISNSVILNTELNSCRVDNSSLENCSWNDTTVLHPSCIERLRG